MNGRRVNGGVVISMPQCASKAGQPMCFVPLDGEPVTDPTATELLVEVLLIEVLHWLEDAAQEQHPGLKLRANAWRLVAPDGSSLAGFGPDEIVDAVLVTR